MFECLCVCVCACNMDAEGWVGVRIRCTRARACVSERGERSFCKVFGMTHARDAVNGCPGDTDAHAYLALIARQEVDSFPETNGFPRPQATSFERALEQSPHLRESTQDELDQALRFGCWGGGSKRVCGGCQASSWPVCVVVGV